MLGAPRHNDNTKIDHKINVIQTAEIIHRPYCAIMNLTVLFTRERERERERAV